MIESAGASVPRIHVTDRKERALVLDAADGQPLMEALRDAGLVEGLCGGNCACATCHVHIGEAWRERVGPPGEDEQVLLDYSMENRPGSRLSCQVRVDEGLDGLILRVAASEG